MIKKKEMICIACPRGCSLTVIDNNGIKVSGNQCSKGENYGRQEFEYPMRILTSTVKTCYKDQPRLPVRLSTSVPLSEVSNYMKAIKKILWCSKAVPGDVVAENLLNSGIDLIATGEIPNE